MFSQRAIVGCEHRSFPLSGNRPQASLKPGSVRNIGHAVADQPRITPIGDQPGQSIRNPQPPFRRTQQHHPAIRSETTTIKRGRDLLAHNGGKTERQKRIIGHRGCGPGR